MDVFGEFRERKKDQVVCNKLSVRSKEAVLVHKMGRRPNMKSNGHWEPLPERGPSTLCDDATMRSGQMAKWQFRCGRTLRKNSKEMFENNVICQKRRVSWPTGQR